LETLVPVFQLHRRRPRTWVVLVNPQLRTHIMTDWFAHSISEERVVVVRHGGWLTFTSCTPSCSWFSYASSKSFGWGERHQSSISPSGPPMFAVHPYIIHFDRSRRCGTATSFPFIPSVSEVIPTVGHIPPLSR